MAKSPARRWPLAVVFAGLAAAGPAAANLVVNGDFELPLLPPTTPRLYAVGDTIDGWQVIGPAGADVAVLNGPFSQFGLTFTHHSGVQSLDLTGLSNTTAGITQDLATVAGTTYELVFHVGNVQSPTVWGTSSSVQVLLDGSAVAVATHLGGPTDTLGWQRFSYQFVATGAVTTLGFVNLDDALDNVNQIDAVSVTAVPEAPAVALMLAGLAAVACARRRGRA